jgi:predicted nucleotidyltransferase component of viral defense system
VLQKKAVVPEIISLVTELQSNPLFKDHVLAGGNINEIAAMKLKAITGRTEARDFIDIAYLLKEMSLNDIFKLFEKKYGSISPLYMKRTLLVKSKGIKENEWLVGIKMLKHDIEPYDIPKIIEENINIYNNSIGINREHKT